MRGDVRTVEKRYRKLSLYTIVGLTLVMLFYIQVTFHHDLALPLVFASVYTLVTSWIYGLSWRKAAQKSAQRLSLFYMAGSGIRMLLAIVVVLIMAFMFHSDKLVMAACIQVFALFFLVQLMIDTYFFARTAKRTADKNNKDNQPNKTDSN